MSELNFIGSKISLISKSAIRYEGLLYAIDTNNATFTLSDVQSFGTEGRPCEKEIPPRAETYKYIVFRSSDINDIHVIDPPRPEESVILSEDPAIVTISQSNPLNHDHSKATGDKDTRKPARSNFPHSPVGPHQAAPHPSHAQQSLSSTQQSYYGESKHRKREDWSSTHTSQADNRKSSAYNHSTNERRYDAHSGTKEHSSPRGPYGNARSGYAYGGYDDSQVNYRGAYHGDYYNDDYYGYGGYPRYYGNYRNADAYYGGAYVDNGRYYSGNSYYSGRYPFRGGEQRGVWTRNASLGNSGRVRSTSRTRFNADYDFEKANAKLVDDMAKLALLGQASKQPPVEEAAENSGDQAAEGNTESTDESKRYDKKKSFFDTISSESMDRLQGIHTGSQLNRREERRVNAETFGNRGGPGGNNRFQGANYYAYANNGHKATNGAYYRNSGRANVPTAGQWTRRRDDTAY